MSGWSCAQIGAREHYAIPRALHRRGLLESLYTDLWAGPIVKRVGRGTFGSLKSRFDPELENANVVRFLGASFRERIRNYRSRPTDVQSIYLGHLRFGKEFGRLVSRKLAKSRTRPSAFFAYSTGALEPLRLLAESGVPTIVDQIDPARTEENIVLNECEKWPGWSAMPGRIPEEYYSRLESEWSTASHVVVNSEWSRDSLIAQGVPADKLVIVPLAFETPKEQAILAKPSKQSFVVLWLGQVILRKGIQYLIEAARRLRSKNVKFVVAGPIGISSQAMKSAPASVEFVGTVQRDQASNLYRSADVFVLPTLSDGFAITQLEAMAHGLPVITTRCCGNVVGDGFDGLIVPPADSEALATAIDRLVMSTSELGQMSQNALESVKRYSIDSLADQLTRIIPLQGETGIELHSAQHRRLQSSQLVAHS